MRFRNILSIIIWLFNFIDMNLLFSNSFYDKKYYFCKYLFFFDNDDFCVRNIVDLIHQITRHNKCYFLSNTRQRIKHHNIVL